MNSKIEFKVKKLFKTQTLRFNISNDGKFEALGEIDREHEFDLSILKKMPNYKIQSDKLLKTKHPGINGPFGHARFGMYLLKDVEKEVRVAELLDIFIEEKFQRKGAGSWLLGQAENLAKQEDCKFVVGEIQEDENLESRKAFFTKNGYEVWYEPSAGFSGWILKKEIRN